MLYDMELKVNSNWEIGVAFVLVVATVVLRSFLRGRVKPKGIDAYLGVVQQRRVSSELHVVCSPGFGHVALRAERAIALADQLRVKGLEFPTGDLASRNPSPLRFEHNDTIVSVYPDDTAELLVERYRARREEQQAMRREFYGTGLR